jgi:hypothetical protein
MDYGKCHLRERRHEDVDSLAGWRASEEPRTLKLRSEDEAEPHVVAKSRLNVPQIRPHRLRLHYHISSAS